MHQFTRRPTPAPAERSVSGVDRADIQYDDGDPATIAPARPRADTAASRRTEATPPATPLADIPRDAAVDYDDGDPATIAC